MSYYNTKQALLTQLINNLPTGLAVGDVAFENKKFDPTNKAAWLSVYFFPATTESTGKTQASSDEQRGFLQVSVFVALNSSEYDNRQLGLVDEIINTFSYNTKMDFLTQTVQTLDSTVNTGEENESWYQRVITINYLTFSNRG